MKVLPAAPPEPRPARPVQVGGANSNAAPATPRQPRALEIDPRAPYRRFPNELRVQYGENPARRGTPRFNRFENYKEATTIGAARRLGATNQDISVDVAAGALRTL